MAQESTISSFELQHNVSHVPYNILDHKLGIKLKTNLNLTTDFADD